MTDLMELASRVEAGEGYDNSQDVEIEVALFQADHLYSAARANAAGTRVIYTRQSDGGQETCWAPDWTGGPAVRGRTAALIRARAHQGTAHVEQ